jgi:hypothetical protein
MDKRQNVKGAMYRTTSNCLIGHAAQVATIPALQAAADELEDNIEAIEENAEIQETATDGVTDGKNVSSTKLCRFASNMAGFVRAMATNTGNVELAAKMNISYSELVNLVDGLLAERCQTIHNDANDNLAALANYSVTAAKLTALQTLIDNYKAKSNAPREAETEGMAATQELKSLFAKTDKLLKEVIDLLMNDFMETDAKFFNRYKASRIIQDAATVTAQFRGTVTNAADGTPLVGAIISTVEDGEPVATKTNAKGKYRLPLSPDGYTLTVSLDGFTTQTLTNQTVTAGEVTTVDVAMVAS